MARHGRTEPTIGKIHGQAYLSISLTCERVNIRAILPRAPDKSRLMLLEALSTPGWRNWQTRQLEVLVGASSCRFESCPGHYSAA